MGFHRGLALFLAVDFQCRFRFAQNFPNKPVRLVIAFTPGSSTDIIGRVVAAKLQEMWGQPVVAENRAGAGGSIGSKYVVDRRPTATRCSPTPRRTPPTPASTPSCPTTR